MPTNELLQSPESAETKSITFKDLAKETSSGKRISPHKTSRKWWVWASVVVVLAVAATLYFRGSAAPAYMTAPIDRGDIQSAITATGTVNAVKTVQVGSQVSGNIIALYADFNT